MSYSTFTLIALCLAALFGTALAVGSTTSTNTFVFLGKEQLLAASSRLALHKTLGYKLAVGFWWLLRCWQLYLGLALNLNALLGLLLFLYYCACLEKSDLINEKQIQNKQLLDAAKHWKALWDASSLDAKDKVSIRRQVGEQEKALREAETLLCLSQKEVCDYRLQLHALNEELAALKSHGLSALSWRRLSSTSSSSSE